MMFFGGRTPVTASLPYNWYDTPNLRFLSIKDFKNYCRRKQIKIIASHYLGIKSVVRFWPNLLAYNAIFVLSAK